jgi:hypothetical protein
LVELSSGYGDVGGRPFPLTVCNGCGAFIEIDTLTAIDYDNQFIGIAEPEVQAKIRVFWHYTRLVPERVRATLAESLRCHRVAAWHGTAVLARKAVEIMAQELGGHGKTLFAKLRHLRDSGLVAEEYWYMEDTVRNLGNLAVHFDPDGDRKCDRAEADCALAYAYEVSKQLYLRPRVDKFVLERDREQYAGLLEVKWRERYGIARSDHGYHRRAELKERDDF